MTKNERYIYSEWTASRDKGWDEHAAQDLADCDEEE